MKQISWKLSKANVIGDPLSIWRKKAVVGHLFSQWTVLTATAWDSIGKSDGLGLNFTCSKFCSDDYLLPCVQPIVWCKKLAFDKLSGRCMRSVRGPAPLCLDAFVPPNQIASQALLECNSKYAAGQKWLLKRGPRVWTWNLSLRLRVTLHISCLLCKSIYLLSLAECGRGLVCLFWVYYWLQILKRHIKRFFL